MPLAENSIIAPGAVNSRAPLKKSTVGWMVGGFFALAAMGVVAPLLLSSDKVEEAPKPVDTPVQAGRAQSIDDEFVKAERQRIAREAQEKREADALAKLESQARPVAPSPVPESARRTDPSAALYETTLDGSKKGAADPESKEFEIDSAARTSKSLAHDFSSTVGESIASGSNSIEDQIRAMVAPPAAGAASSGESSALGQNQAAIDALIRAQGAQPSGAPVSADRAWLREFAKEGGTNKPIKPYGVTSPYTLLQGKVMPAVLGRNINTDLPGQITACLTIDIYDSITSDYLLIPKGSCLVGEYSSSVRPGQDRVMFAFSRIMMPDGRSFDLPGAPGADLGGASGIGGNVNNHFFRMFSTSFLVAWLADRFESKNTSPSTNIGATSGAKTAAGQVLVDTSKTILERDKIIAPTITVPKGTQINVEVTRDMEFPGPYRR